jgi:thrombospondin type 3 repeat protein
VADRLRRMRRRLADLGTGLVDALVRDNRVLPPVLAVLGLFLIAWVLAGAFMGETGQKTVAHKSGLAQSDNPGASPATPGVQNRDVNSYAAYRSKDPFREILAPEETTTSRPTTPPERTTPETTTGPRRTPRGPGAANKDTDADGIPDRRERKIGSNPNNPDTDGDGIPDGSDNDTNAGGRPRTGGATPGTPPTGRGAKSPPNNRNDDLLNSGGTLPLP